MRATSGPSRGLHASTPRAGGGYDCKDAFPDFSLPFESRLCAALSSLCRWTYVFLRLYFALDLHAKYMYTLREKPLSKPGAFIAICAFRRRSHLA